MKIKHKGGMKNKENSAAFVNIEDFDGVEMRISTELLQKALDVVDVLHEHGLDTEYINIGIGRDERGEAGQFFVFLDSERTVAYCVAGAISEKEGGE